MNTFKSKSFFQVLLGLAPSAAIIIIIFMLLLIPVLLLLPKHWPSESAAELERISSEVAIAETRWKAHNLTNYDLDVWVFIHLGRCFTDLKEGKPTTLQVREGQLLLTDEVRQQGLEEECHISNLLPPQAFETVRDRLKQANPNENYLSIEFDPEYGFIKRYFLTSNSSGSDLSVLFEFSNLRPVATQ